MNNGMEMKVMDFSLDKTLNAGQTFAWEKVGDCWYSFISEPVAIKQLSETVLEIFGSDEAIVRRLLSLDDDIISIKAELDKDDFLDKAIAYSSGLRVINDGLWPATLGFILSIQSNIPLIKRRISNLSKFYGKTGEVNGIKLHSFPSYNDIYNAGMEKLKDFKLGFRTKFVFDAAEYFSMHELSENFDIEELKKHLLDIKGVGEKVLDCILLYGLHDLSSFPMDVWILRVLSKHYGKLIDNAKSYKLKRDAMTKYFGKYAGYAQLYIYNYLRLNKIK